MVSLKFSAWMIGPSFVTYAPGSVAAVTNKRAVKAGMSEAFILASLRSGLWIFGLVSIPYMLVGRFFSGFFMF